MKKVTDAEGSEIDRHYLVKELYKQEDAEFRRDEFAEKIIQYGYLVVLPNFSLSGAVIDIQNSSRFGRVFSASGEEIFIASRNEFPSIFQLFACSFPLAPLLSLGYNVFDLRIDSNRLLWINRRPIPFRDDDIGEKGIVLTLLNPRSQD